MNVFAIFAQRVKDAAGALVAAGSLPATLDLARIVVEPPRDASHGDIATNAAMVLAKDAGMKPRDLAELIAAQLRSDADIEKVDIAGPGFINLTLKAEFWPRVLAAVLEAGANYGKGAPEAPIRVNVEYVSANPTGPMHVGHCRGAVFGDALANLIAFAGHDVTREYYINDAGAQVDVLARSAYLRYREALGEAITIPDGLYPGDYLVPVGKQLVEAYGERLLDIPETEWLPLVRDAAIDAMMSMIRDDLGALAIHHDVFFSERQLHQGGKIAETIADLTARGYVYRGTLPPPKGQVPEDWEDREQLLLRSTDAGDDMDRPLVKSDGSYTYFAADVAYFRDKFERGFDEMIYVLGADHGGYVKRLEAVGRAIAGDKATVDVKLVQLVRLFRAGEPVKMSKRAGEFVTLRDVVDEVGKDAVRFMMLYRKNDAVLDFDFAKVVEQSRDNAVFYVQYAHARASSILRKGRELLGADCLPTAESHALDSLKDAGEIALIKRLAEFPRQIEAAATAHEPHRIAFYLNDLSGIFHAQWNRGKDAPYLRFIIEEDKLLSQSRLALVHGVKSVLATGLALLGVSAPDEMR